jgi:murein peptide amidase A
MEIVRGAYSYDELLRAWKELANKQGFSLQNVPGPGERALLYAEIGAPGKPVISLTSGMHGDEQAAPWALFSIVRDGLLDSRFSYHVWPCVNPTGYRAGTRCNAEGKDINRSFNRGGETLEARAVISKVHDRRYLMQIDMHEDPEAEGFYCYEPTSQPGGFHGSDVVAAVSGAGFPLQEMCEGFDLGYAADTLHLQPGRVLYDCVESAETVSGLLLNVYLFCRRVAHRVTTFETPGTRPWDERVEMHRLAVSAALEHLTRTSASSAA